MLHENTVIELDALAAESKKFLIPLLCLWLYYVRLNSPDREQLKLVIFIEEAHHVLHKKAQTANETILEMLFRQCRELGIGIVVIDQHPHLLSSAALGNTYTTIFLNQKDPADINKAAAVCQLDVDDKKYFSMLPVGQAIIKLQDRWMNPIHVQFPLINVNKGSVTDSILARYSAEISSRQTHSPLEKSIQPIFNGFPHILFDVTLEKPALQLLYDILLHPLDGVRQRYRHLALSDKKGHRTKETLLRHGWIEGQLIEIGRTRKLILRLSEQAKKTLDLNNEIPEYGSLEHEYWKQFYAQRFRDKGYEVTLEAHRGSGRVDIAAVKDDQKTAIEIETGKSDFLNNLRQNLTAKYDRILIVATNRKAFDNIEHTLAREGLLIPSRIKLVLQEQYI